MAIDLHRKSNLYGLVQSLLIVVFGVVFFFAHGPALFSVPAAAIVGNILSVAGLILMAAAFVPLRDVIQIAPAPREDGHLVTSGVYSRFRHPIYSGIVLLVTGLFLREPAVGVAVAGALVIAFLLIKARFEEALLTARYPEYADYRKKAWGVFPGL